MSLAETQVSFGSTHKWILFVGKAWKRVLLQISSSRGEATSGHFAFEIGSHAEMEHVFYSRIKKRRLCEPESLDDPKYVWTSNSNTCAVGDSRAIVEDLDALNGVDEVEIAWYHDFSCSPSLRWLNVRAILAVASIPCSNVQKLRLLVR